MNAFSQLLVVCTGNICRSPLAEALLRQRLAATRPSAQVRSAGTAAVVDEPADPMAQQFGTSLGVDLGAHRGRQLDREALHWADLVLVLDDGHRQQVLALDPAVRGKVFLLGHFGVGAIPDPYRRSPEFWQGVTQFIDQSVSEWAARL